MTKPTYNYASIVAVHLLLPFLISLASGATLIKLIPTAGTTGVTAEDLSTTAPAAISDQVSEELSAPEVERETVEIRGGSKIYAGLECQRASQGRNGNLVRAAKANVVVFSDSYHWAVGSATRVRLEGVDVPFFDELKSAASYKEQLTEANLIIVFGTASCETGAEDQEGLARRRAVWLRNQIGRIAAGGEQRVRLASLGWARPMSEQCSGNTFETRTQRKVILVALYSQENGSDFIQRCLREAVDSHDRLRNIFHFYERWRENDIDMDWE
ncbi:MAG: hypothetical protein AAGD01_19880 [Acidobacteriota bacterium]